MLLLGLTICTCLPVLAQTKHKKAKETTEAERPASDARSFMELFTKLERDWLLAVQHKDKQALENVLAPEFILRRSSDPEHPILRANWIQDALNNWDPRTFKQREMAIRAFASNAIVSFVETQQASVNGRNKTEDYFIVDLWVVNHGDWQIAARYLSPIHKQLTMLDTKPYIFRFHRKSSSARMDSGHAFQISVDVENLQV